MRPRRKSPNSIRVPGQLPKGNRNGPNDLKPGGAASHKGKKKTRIP